MYRFSKLVPQNGCRDKGTAHAHQQLPALRDNTYSKPALFRQLAIPILEKSPSNQRAATQAGTAAALVGSTACKTEPSLRKPTGLKPCGIWAAGGDDGRLSSSKPCPLSRVPKPSTTHVWAPLPVQANGAGVCAGQPHFTPNPNPLGALEVQWATLRLLVVSTGGDERLCC